MDIKKEFLKSIPLDKATEEALLKVADEKRLRNYLIIKEFDILMKAGNLGINKIQKAISKKYDISARLVRMVVSERRENQI